ncbi:MAG: DNA alkylation repair protein [Calditrichaeota bacterium]|nr:MAG: DNA alkylation repair protein [Calditrichota bacterium]
MNLQDAMALLEAAGTPQNRQIYSRHGVQGDCFGVSFADLNKLKKAIKVDHELAQELWATGNHDAQVLATMIADAKGTQEPLVDAWVKELGNHMIADAFASFVSQTPFARKKVTEWTCSQEEWVGRAGWHLLAILLKDSAALSETELEACLTRIEADIHTSKNRVKEAMNSALMAIGIYREALRDKALRAAGRIGKVEVDHGETNCKTPDAATYIQKAVARQRARSG